MAMPRCLYCGLGFIPGLKNPNVCGNCYKRRVAIERRKAGLRPIPKLNMEVREKREREKKKFLEWYREEAQSDNFGKKIRIKRKVKDEGV